MAYIPSRWQKKVAERAKYRCEYCQSLELITGGPLHIEHIVPQSQGGESVLDNLAYSCARCNLYKATRTHYQDPVTTQQVPLFNPRTQHWKRHFIWSSDGVRIIGRTKIGRATVVALKMNHPTIVMARSVWVQTGFHPPR